MLAISANTGARAAPAAGVQRIEVERFALLPEGARQPEGLAVDPTSGDIFVGTFDAREPATERRNAVVRLNRNGQLEAIRDFGMTPLTGVMVSDGQVYVLNFGGAKLQRLPVDFTADTAVQTLARFAVLTPSAPGERQVTNPDGSVDVIRYGANGVPAPNGMAMSRVGDLYVSDSFQGAIYRIPGAAHCDPCEVQVFSRSPLLATTGALPFGANGLAFDTDEQWLYLTNAGDGRLLRLRMADAPAGGIAKGELQVVAEYVPGADGLMFHRGLFWVAANQADQIQAFDASGLLRVSAGHFDGIGSDGAPNGLLFPAGTAATDDGWMLVANLSLALTPQSGDEWEERVSRWSLARFRIPKDLP
ncbi:MAG TPA: hypothetical protein VGC74_10155 [Stenotrophomonas sp.]